MKVVHGSRLPGFDRAQFYRMWRDSVYQNGLAKNAKLTRGPATEPT